MPGDYTLPRYGFSTQWSKFVIDRASAGQTPPGSSGPGPNLGQDVSMSSPVTNVKTTSGTTWTAAPRAVMTAPASSVETILTGVTQPVTIPTSAPIQVESPALLKPVSLSTQAQPEMSTITITESTTVVSASASSLTSAPRFTVYRPGSQSTGQFSLSSSSVSPIFQSMALESSSERQSMASSMKIQTTIREEEISIPIEEMEQMLSEPLQSFLDKFTDYSTAGVNLLHVRAIFSVLEKLGYTLEENLPPVERPGLSDLSLFAYLQITEPMPSSNIIVIDLNEFNDLLNRVVCDQLGAFKRSFKSITITAEQLPKFAHIVVRDPTGFLAFKEPTSASATSSTALPQPAAGQETFMNAFQAALLATIKSIAPPATSVSQQSASASTPMSSLHLLPASMTDTGSQLTAGLESDMDMQQSDLGADLGDGAAHGAAELQPEPQPESRTSAVTTETTRPKKPAPQRAEPKVKKDKSGHTSRPKKRMRISEGESATSAAAVPAQPETTQSEELIMLESETPLYSTSLRGTPLRESARAAKLLIGK